MRKVTLLFCFLLALGATAQVKVKKAFPDLFPQRAALSSQPQRAAGLNDNKFWGVECLAATQTDANNQPGVIRFYSGDPTETREKIVEIRGWEYSDVYTKFTMLGSTLYKDVASGETSYLGYEVINYDMGWGAWPERWFKVDVATGDTVTLSKEIKDLKWRWFTVEAACQNPVTGELWGMCRNDSMSLYNPEYETQELVSRVGRIMPDNGEFDEVAKLDHYYMGMAFDAKGQMWAIRPVFGSVVDEEGVEWPTIEGSVICRLDMENNFAEIDPVEITKTDWSGTSGPFLMWWNNSIAFDYSTGELYALLCEYNENGYCRQYMYRIDRTTGELKNPATNDPYGAYLYDISYGLAIPSFFADAPEAPARVQNLSGEGIEGGTKVKLTWTNPTLSWGGEELQGISDVLIYRGSLEGEPVGTVTGAEMGAESTWTDEAPLDGVNTYYVLATLDGKKGVPDSWNVYAGEDTPAEVQNLQIMRNGSKIELSWEAPIEGQHQGVYDAASLTYSIQRLPDSTMVAENIAETSFVDRNLPALLNYQYIVTPSTKKGVGEPMSSDYVMAGPAYEPPYTTDFATYADADAWTIIDNNEDWTQFWYSNGDPASTGLGIYTNSYGTCDDYAISPAVKLQAGHTYKVNFTIYFQYADTEDSPTKHDFDMTVGEGTTVEAQSTVLKEVRQFGNDQMYTRHDFSAQYTPENDGEYNFGFRLLTAYTYDNLALVGASIKEVVDKDLAATKLAGGVNPSCNTPSDYKVTVKNEGRLEAAGYNVKVVRLDGENQVVLGQTAVVDALAAEADTVIKVTVTPDVEGDVQIAAVVEYEGDAVASNNTSAPFSISVSPEGTVPFNVEVNDGTNLAQNTDMPIYFYKNYSTIQSIYYPSDFSEPLDPQEEHAISRLAFVYSTNDGATVADVPVKIYVGTTDIEAYTAEEWGSKVELGAWIPLTDQKLVFDGTISSKPGQDNLLVFDFIEPYAYDASKNLVVTVVEEGEWENKYPMIFNHYASDGYSDVYRSLRYGSNSQQFDFETADLLPKNCFARQGLAVMHLAVTSTTGIQHVTVAGEGSAAYDAATGSISLGGVKASNVAVYNAAGQVVAQGANSKLNLTTGVYVVKAVAADGKVYTSKLQVK